MSAQPEDAPRGFVPMREYLRLQRRLDEIEEELAYLQSEARDDVHAETIAILRVRLKLPQSCVLVLREICLAGEAGAIPERIRDRVGTSNVKTIDVHIWKINKSLSAQGSPRAIGYRVIYGRRVLTPDGRQWLQARAPELFAKGGQA